jgi:hypothetical protein
MAPARISSDPCNPASTREWCSRLVPCDGNARSCTAHRTRKSLLRVESGRTGCGRTGSGRRADRNDTRRASQTLASGLTLYLEPRPRSGSSQQRSLCLSLGRTCYAVESSTATVKRFTVTPACSIRGRTADRCLVSVRSGSTPPRAGSRPSLPLRGRPNQRRPDLRTDHHANAVDVEDPHVSTTAVGVRSSASSAPRTAAEARLRRDLKVPTAISSTTAASASGSPR